MKTKLQRFLSLLIVVLFVSLSAFAQYGRVLEENFEKGIPQTWSQEVVNDNLLWTIESGDLTFPNSASSGEKRVAFRNLSGKTKNATTWEQQVSYLL